MRENLIKELINKYSKINIFEPYKEDILLLRENNVPLRAILEEYLFAIDTNLKEKYKNREKTAITHLSKTIKRWNNQLQSNKNISKSSITSPVSEKTDKTIPDLPEKEKNRSTPPKTQNNNEKSTKMQNNNKKTTNKEEKELTEEEEYLISRGYSPKQFEDWINTPKLDLSNGDPEEIIFEGKDLLKIPVSKLLALKWTLPYPQLGDGRHPVNVAWRMRKKEIDEFAKIHAQKYKERMMKKGKGEKKNSKL